LAAPYALDNLPDQVPRVIGGYFEEDGAGTYNFDVFVPAGAIIDDIGIHGEVLWAAATSASMEVGDYAAVRNDNSDGWEISTAIDADGFFTAVNLKATDLTAGQSLSFDSRGATEAGAYLADTATQWVERFSLVDRYVRFSVVSVGAGATGRTAVWVKLLRPAWTTVTQ
jgi:hypothetical protein